MERAPRGYIAGVAVVLVALGLGLGMNGRLLYCVRCGARSTRSGWEFWGHQVWSRERVSESGYSLLHDRYIGRDGAHAWQQYSSSRVGLVNSRVGSGSVPMIVLTSPARLAGVERLGDPRRIRTVIAAFDLERPYDHSVEDRKYLEVRELGAVSTRAEADAWWRKHGREFERAAAGERPTVDDVRH